MAKNDQTRPAKKSYHFEMNADLLNEFQSRCKMNGESSATVLRRLIMMYLDNEQMEMRVMGKFNKE